MRDRELPGPRAFHPKKRGWQLILAVCGMALSMGTGGETLPKEVQQELGAINQLCIDAGGRPGHSPKLLQTLQLRADAPRDYVINTGEAKCEGTFDPYEGSGGSTVVIYATRQDGTVFQAFSGGADGVQVKQQKGAVPAQLSLRVGGQLCGQKKNARSERAYSVSCWRPIRWNQAQSTFDYAPVSEIRAVR